MLSEEENRINLECVKYLTSLNIVPFHFEGNMIKCAPVRKLYIWTILVMVEILHVLLAIGNLIVKIRDEGTSSIPTLTLDFCFIAPPAVAIFAAVQYFWRHPDVTIALWRNVKPAPKLLKSQRRNGPLWGYTYLEVYTILLACGFYQTAFAVVLAYVFIHTLPVTEGLHAGLRGAFILLQGALVLSWVSWLHFTVLIQITFMEKLGLALKATNENIKYEFG